MIIGSKEEVGFKETFTDIVYDHSISTGERQEMVGSVTNKVSTLTYILTYA